MAKINSQGGLAITSAVDGVAVGRTAANGNTYIVSVDGSTYTGINNTGGALNVFVDSETDGVSDLGFTGCMHPCGALRVINQGANIGYYSPSGAVYIN
jgi:hypothetical protein